MSELLPCPFCGGEAQIAHLENGWQLKQTHDDSCWLSDATTVKAVIGEWDETKAIAAWNSRAERVTDDEWEIYQHSVPATEENMARFGWVRERTCRNLDKHYNIMFKCSECGHWECQDFDGEKMLPQTWNYCPNCGCKVVSE